MENKKPTANKKTYTSSFEEPIDLKKVRTDTFERPYDFGIPTDDAEVKPKKGRPKKNIQ